MKSQEEKIEGKNLLIVTLITIVNFISWFWTIPKMWKLMWKLGFHTYEILLIIALINAVLLVSMCFYFITPLPSQTKTGSPKN